MGTRPALAAATVILALGTGLAGLGQSPILALLAGTLLGGTFIGVTALAMTLARELVPQAPARAGGLVTTAFGLGQVAGPIIAGRLLTALGPGPALLVPAAVALLGTLALAAGGPSPAPGSTPAPRVPS
jgi:MFS family permease